MGDPRDGSEGEERAAVTPAAPRTAREKAADRAPAPPAAASGEARGEGPAEIEIPPDCLIIVCLRNLVLFPGVVLPVALGRKRSVAAVREAVRRELPIGLLQQKDEKIERPRPEDLYQVGTVANVLRFVTAPDGGHHIISQGQQRFRVRDHLRQEPFPVARVELVADREEKDQEIEARTIHLKSLAEQALGLLPHAPPELKETILGLTSPSLLCDFLTTYMDLTSKEKQEILETFDIRERLGKVGERLTQRLEVLKLSHEIGERTKGRMDKAQREYYLREQLKAIQKELGEEDAKNVEIEELSEKIARAGMPEEVEKEARRELARLERMNEAAAEYSMIRTYLEWLTELPWSKSSGEEIDIARARKVLDEDHYGLEKVKRRMVEFLAVRKLKRDVKSPILCLVGPPGVGKTSLGRSVARALGREFVRISLGGCHDEAEVRGHRRTYIGAMPGNIVQGIRRAGTNNPVFMLDEIDKMSASFHGDPASALLEVLDPEQNSTFRDNYLGVPFDLRQVMFIGTANVLEAIPGPLRDRCEVIRLPGYTTGEKLEIARRYLVGRQIDANGLEPEQISFGDEALQRIVREYTREAGCRNLEREIGAICRFVATEVADGKSEPIRIDAPDVERILGAARYENEAALRTSTPGVATGLAWTPVGGDLLFIEATRMPGTGELILTGQLGDVMKESGQTALSLVKSRAAELGLDPGLFHKSDLHIHVPAGAIPKDGPSAGVALFVAIVSLLAGRRVWSHVAMTGEISLRGLVLPVGGIKEKVVAAHGAGIETVLLPARNRKDLEDIPEGARRSLRFVWLENASDALEAALEPAAEHPAAG